MDDTFWEEYGARARQVMSAGYKTFPDRISRWLTVLDEDRDVHSVLSPLEGSFDFEGWLNDTSQSEGSMIGSAELAWPQKDAERIAAHMGLCRRWASSVEAAPDFGLTFFGTTHFDDGIRQIQHEVFGPFADDLERYLKRHSAQSGIERPRQAPAADRVVLLTHNSEAVLAGLDRLDAVGKAVAEANDYEDVNDRAQRLSEIEAGKALLRAPQTRLSAVREVLFKCLRYLGEKFADHLIGIAISAALTALAAIFGIHALL
jgi:hypothetical protein